MRQIIFIVFLLVANTVLAQVVTSEITVVDQPNNEINDHLQLNGNLTSTGSITSGGNIHFGGSFFGGNGLETYNLSGYSGGSRTTSTNLRAANKSFHAQVTITGQQGNLHNEKHMWHGGVTYDHTNNQINVYTISYQGVNVAVQKNISTSQIELVVTSTASYGLYVIHRGTTMISSGT